jgi:hypothetical protein
MAAIGTPAIVAQGRPRPLTATDRDAITAVVVDVRERHVVVVTGVVGRLGRAGGT